MFADTVSGATWVEKYSWGKTEVQYKQNWS